MPRNWPCRRSFALGGTGISVSALAIVSMCLLLLSACSRTKTEENTPINTTTTKKSALIIVDMQNDFCPGGSLAVKEGDQIIPIINRLQEKFDLVVATQDWHPANHSSFSSQSPEGIWPDHCVQGTAGAEFVPGLESDHIARIIKKGADVAIDSYSGFYDNDHRTATGLGDYLRTNGVTDVFVVGLATDYCVKFTALDAVQKEELNATLIRDATRGVDLKEGDVERAVEEMKNAGVAIIESSEILD